MAYNFNSAKLHLQTLMQRNPKGQETADHLRNLRSRLNAEADRIMTEAKAAMAEAKAKAAALKKDADNLPPDFEGEKPTTVADFTNYGSPSGFTPTPAHMRPRKQTPEELDRQFRRATNLDQKGL
ncbi:hypothetical protein [Amaricoccus solimangrovi]|uniref:Uncharacterized protein n=1 Tax=Amaricoccus solimangrovi TaxID=2589815 RepID=A0A501WK66_9RHOB|nr:hypothetical protein [Amaricoccus solimangrovi]TPE47547.1 hypothetical protein FJM51_19630 [Amaricoccus solimangrovi]